MQLSNVSPGDPLSVRADDFNYMIGAARQLRDRTRIQAQGLIPTLEQYGQFVLVKNTTPEAIGRNGIIALDDSLFVPEWLTASGGSWKMPPQFMRGPTFKGVKPTANHRGRYAVAIRAIKPGAIDKCLVSGVVACLVRLQEDSDRICDIKVDATDMMESSPWGSGKILYSIPAIKRNQATTETRKLAWCIVHVGGPLHFIPFRAEVTDIDVQTWGAGRKKLKVKRLVRHPRGIDGPEFECDGGIDTLIGCGDQVLVQEAQYVFGDPIQDQYPPLVATPINAHDQSNLPQPDPTATAFVPTPGLPLLPEPPCTSP